MKILFQVPHLSTIYAGLATYYGYESAFRDLGHEFKFLTADDDQERTYNQFCPDFLITSMNRYFLKFLDLDLLKKQKRKGLKVFVNTPFWKSPLSRLRINEAPSLSQRGDYIDLIKSGDYGDAYYNITERGDVRMEGFEKEVGYKHYTILLAADRNVNIPSYDEKFKADVSFIGTNLPDRRRAFKEKVFPLRRKYNLRLYGQDWTAKDKFFGILQRFGQYYNIPGLKSFQKRPIEQTDVPKVYSSTLISINVHEDYQVKFGGDCNSRTFEIPMSGGFEIVDDVACIRKYFNDGEEIIIAKDVNEWFEKIDYYIKNPEKREPIIKAGRKKALKDHTYHNRVEQLLSIYKGL